MCGITGLFFKDGTPASPSLLQAMNDTIIHRGPDAEGNYIKNHVGLAMRRLKVIDLSTGDQPIHNENKKLWIVFNGEIYNYRELQAGLARRGHKFYTKSDTEVIVHLYQEYREKCVDLLIGMFAFAIYDEDEDSLFIARDRLGVKPLFYHQGPKGLVFGSEIKPLLKAPWIEKTPNPQAISHFLSLNYLPQPWTPLEGIYQLAPGHWMKYTPKETRIHSYWDPVPKETLDVDEDEAGKTIMTLLHRSMERRLIADVPIGTFLSGGLDSSALVYLMKEHRHEKVKTFSVGFDEPSYDETPYARRVAEHFGTDHHELRCKPEDVIENLSRVAWHADNLLGDQAALPLYLVSALAKKHVTVCLSGEGGDEVFVGYPTFKADYYFEIYSKLPAALRSVFRAAMNRLPVSYEKLSFEYKAKKFTEAGDFSPEKAHYWWRTIYRDEEKKSLLHPAALEKIQSLDSFRLYGDSFDKSKGADFVNRALYADLKVWLAGNNLYKADTMTMAHGLEARVPFLDHEFVEYMTRLKPELKFKGRKLKYLMKKVFAGKLPDSILARKKAGFHTPIGKWFAGPLKTYLQDTLLKENPCFENLLNRQAVEAMLQSHFSGKGNHTFRIWGLLVLSSWMRHLKNNFEATTFQTVTP